MKELQLLNEWADSIINEFAKDGNLPLTQDPIRQTQIKYPHLSRDEAASKYLDDITSDFKDQNAVINAQSKKSEKLEKVVGDQNLTISKLNKEIDDLENNSNLQSTATNDKLKQIDNIKKISDEEHRRLVDKIDSLQNKPGMTDERYAELMKRVDDFQKNGVDPQKIKEFERRIESMSRQESVGKADFERLQALMSKVEQGQSAIAKDKVDVSAKLADIERRQAEIENREKQHDTEVKAEVEKEVKKVRDKMADYAKRVKTRSKTTKQRVDDLVGNKNERLDDLKNTPPRVDTLEPEVLTVRTLAQDVGDEVDQLQDVVSRQEQQIQYLAKNQTMSASARQYRDSTSRQNPYDNVVDDDDENNNAQSRQPPKNNNADFDVDMNGNIRRRGKNDGLQWDESINEAINSLLGPQLAKYLK